ncbi:hypothetical protein [Sinomonas susongensis]|uniref:hypothetical protein n=1 Tax=Sinomonas susongensis TaxID=1324851 RepID=UPI0011083EE8|nr:hypothetical protein [Sinomonas susongensis]
MAEIENRAQPEPACLEQIREANREILQIGQRFDAVYGPWVRETNAELQNGIRNLSAWLEAVKRG